MIPVGTHVRIRLEPGCSGEGNTHGIFPYLREAVGIVEPPPRPGAQGDEGHDHWVFLFGIEHHSWFRADELVPEGVQ